MQSFQITNIPGQVPKNYVFVDEHNRHKRLKVMRACEGCRRRKIKCDAATTNSWPCAACKRLKLTCVPPVGGLDGDLSVIDTNVEQFGTGPASAPPQQFPGDHLRYHEYGSQTDLSQSFSAYEGRDPSQAFNQQDYAFSAVPHLDHDHHAPTQQMYVSQPRLQSFDSANGYVQSVGSPQSTDSITAEELADNLGDLRIGDSGVAPYIRQQNASEAPAPILEDDEELPAFSTAAGSQIRIPPALMPSNDEVKRSFQDYFQHVHPYVPVLCRQHFIRQWQQNRESISPLLLEAVLACAGQVSDDPAGGSQWLALANRHEESFADTPRLSTIQALLLLLKAREKTPKRGYYYRSWITIRKIVGMAKDLELHEHLDQHLDGAQCDSDPVECLTKTRVWQLAMVLELMVGGPQGRSDYSVDIDTVDLNPSPPNSDIDDFERTITRQFTFWVRNVRNIRAITETYHKLKRKNKDWATDQVFARYNQDFQRWPTEVPGDLNILISEDGSLPVLPSHFVGNMHCHYQLGIVMLYKPQLAASKDFMNDPKWKNIMFTCYSAAKRVCVIQEAISKQYNILGLAAIQRGLSFPIYAILTCVMVHLVAITSPDPVFNQDSKDYFVRHMRVLERCILDWPMPEVESQILSLRAAFSANLERPFALKPTFPYGTPSENSKSPEERRSSEPSHHAQHMQNQQQYMQQQQMQHGNYFPTPPASARPGSKPHEQSLYSDYDPRQQAQFHHVPPTSTPTNVMTPTEPWNPTPIINQFNTAFAIPPSALAPPQASSYGPNSPVVMNMQNYGQMANQHMPSPMSAGGYSSHQAYTPSPTSQPMSQPQSFMPPAAQAVPPPQLTPTHYPQQQSYFEAGMAQPQTSQIPQQIQSTPQSQTGRSDAALPNMPVYVTPKEWQQSVASVFDPGGMKRKWDYEQQLAMQQGRAPGYG